MRRQGHPLAPQVSYESGNKAMPIDLDELLPRKKAPDIVLGEDLAAKSEHELVERIAELDREIVRCREAIAVRQLTRSAADSVFRKR